MDKILIKDIRELAKIMAEHGLSSVSVEDGQTSVKLKRQGAESKAEQAFASAPAPVSQPAAKTAPAVMDSVVDFNRLTEVKSPMIGVFYAAPSESAAPFVKVGDKVRKGDVLCIIEAMKMMNEITADSDGEVVDICVESGTVVEFSQVLFKLC